MLGPQDVGRRVVVRHRVDLPDDNRPHFTDALGELVELTGTTLTVATRSGPVTVERSRVVAARRVPPPPPNPRRVTALEQAAADAWPAPEQTWLGRWLLRAAGGFSGRANSALILGDPGMRLPAAVEEITRWYADRGLPLRVQAPLPTGRRVEPLLEAAGWRRGPVMLVQTAPLETLADRLAPADEVALLPEPDGGWLAVAARLHAPAGPPAPLPPEAMFVLTAGGRLPVRFAAVHDPHGTLVAAGRGVVSDAWLHLSRITVHPEHRRRGLARRVMAALVGWARTEGATGALLHVEDDNEAALALYARLGFTTHHTCHLWAGPPPRT